MSSAKWEARTVSDGEPVSRVIGRFLAVLVSWFGWALIGQWAVWPDHSPVAVGVGAALIAGSCLVFQVLLIRTRVEKLEMVLSSLEKSLRALEKVRR